MKTALLVFACLVIFASVSIAGYVYYDQNYVEKTWISRDGYYHSSYLEQRPAGITTYRRAQLEEAGYRLYIPGQPRRDPVAAPAPTPAPAQSALRNVQKFRADVQPGYVYREHSADAVPAPTVIVQEGDGFYHRADCRCLSFVRRTSCEEQAARLKGYKPCTICLIQNTLLDPDYHAQRLQDEQAAAEQQAAADYQAWLASQPTVDELRRQRESEKLRQLSGTTVTTEDARRNASQRGQLKDFTGTFPVR